MEKCPNCNNKLYHAYKLNYNILKCKSCKLQIAENAFFKPSFNSLLNEELREKALKGVRLNNFVKIINYIASYFPNKQIHGLEVGCSYGWFLELCEQNQIDCIGIEPETRFNEYYKKNRFYVINGFYPQDFDTEKKFDFIVFNDVLEHIPDINNVMTANNKYLNPSGLLIINIPVQNGLFHLGSVILYYLGVKSFLNRMWQFNFHSPHLYYFKIENIVRIAKKYNLEIIDKMPLQVIDKNNIQNRVRQDNSISRVKLTIVTIIIHIIAPLEKFRPDIYCLFFRKSS